MAPRSLVKEDGGGEGDGEGFCLLIIHTPPRHYSLFEINGPTMEILNEKHGFVTRSPGKRCFACGAIVLKGAVSLERVNISPNRPDCYHGSA